jgi:hypothetical protein
MQASKFECFLCNGEMVFGMLTLMERDEDVSSLFKLLLENKQFKNT